MAAMSDAALAARPEEPTRRAFHSVEGILLLRLMSRCNERCVFCMVEDEIAESDDIPFEDALEAIRLQPPGTVIEFFGGEPTIYPRFLHLLTEARRLGFDCAIATNARIFHSKVFTAKVAALGRDRLYVRTSLHGADAATHDALTRTRNSFVQTAAGVVNLVAEGIPSQVNIVITRDNHRQLLDMVDLVHGWGVPRIKFGNLIALSTCRDQGVRLSAVRPLLEAAIERAEMLGLAVTVEKTPICCAGGRIDLLSTERDAFGGRRLLDTGGTCANCLVARWCDGVDPDYAALYGFDDLTTIDKVPRSGLIDAATDPLPEPQLLRTYCVLVDGRAPLDLAERLTAILPKVRAQHGRFAVFPEDRTISGAQAQRV